MCMLIIFPGVLGAWCYSGFESQWPWLLKTFNENGPGAREAGKYGLHIQTAEGHPRVM